MTQSPPPEPDPKDPTTGRQSEEVDAAPSRRRPLRGLRWTVRPPSRWQVALRASIAIGVPLSVATLIGHQDLGLLVGPGAFTVLYGAGRPWRTRLRLLLAVALSLVGCIALGTLTSGSAVLGIALVVAISVIATVVCQALRVGVPGAFFFVLAAGLGGYLPLHGVPGTTLIATTAIGAGFAVLVAMADVLARPRGPQEDAVARARRAVTDVLAGERAGPGAEQRSARAVEALHDAWTALAEGADPASSHTAEQIAETRELQRQYAGHLLPGEPPHPELAAESTGAGLGRASGMQMLRHGLRWPSNALQAAVRVGTGVLTAGVIASLIGVDHVYWAMAAAMLVLHTGLDRRRTAVRSLHRLAGTGVGLGLFLLVHLVTDINPWVVVGVVVALQGMVELFVARNYAVAVVFITPLALTIASAGTDHAPTLVAGERLLDTAIGVIIGAAVPWLVGRRGAPDLLRACIARVLSAVAEVVDHLGAGTQVSEAGRRTRRDLALAVQEMSAAAGRGMTDDPRGVAPLHDLREATAWLALAALTRAAGQRGPAGGLTGAAWACRVLARQTAEGHVVEVSRVTGVSAALGQGPPLQDN